MPSEPGSTTSGQGAMLHALVRDIGEGRLSIEEAVVRIAAAVAGSAVATDDAHVDVSRQTRCGFPEVIYAEGKSPGAVRSIMQTVVEHCGRGFATRVSPEQAAALATSFPGGVHNTVGRTFRVVPSAESAPAGRVVIVTAGTSDRPVAEEAVETLKWMECGVGLLVDIGVAGPTRLLDHKHRFDGADAIVVIAGMEGALPSVVGGWVSCPVIAVPTSVGYGASFGGLAALLGMLNSCASNVCVVNIDAGFKGAYVAGMIALRAHAPRETR